MTSAIADAAKATAAVSAALVVAYAVLDVLSRMEAARADCVEALANALAEVFAAPLIVAWAVPFPAEAVAIVEDACTLIVRETDEYADDTRSAVVLKADDALTYAVLLVAICADAGAVPLVLAQPLGHHPRGRKPLI